MRIINVQRLIRIKLLFLFGEYSNEAEFYECYCDGRDYISIILHTYKKI